MYRIKFSNCGIFKVLVKNCSTTYKNITHLYFLVSIEKLDKTVRMVNNQVLCNKKFCSSRKFEESKTSLHLVLRLFKFSNSRIEKNYGE